jgi:hypothetical protein
MNNMYFFAFKIKIAHSCIDNEKCCDNMMFKHKLSAKVLAQHQYRQLMQKTLAQTGISKLHSYKLSIFVLKRVVICAGVLTVVCIALTDLSWLAVAGLWLGSFLGVLRLFANNRMLNGFVPKGIQERATVKSIILYIKGIMAAVAAMTASIAIDKWMFAGVVAGLLLSVFVIIVNIFTEFLGLTRNNFE